MRVITAIQLHFLFQSLQRLSQLTHTATRQIAHHLVVSFKLKGLLLGLLVKLFVGCLEFAVFLGVRLTVLLQLRHLVVEVFHVLFQHGQHALSTFAVSGYYNFTFEVISCHNCMRVVFVFNFYANILKVADALRT